MTRDQKLYCSFCGKGQQECEWLLAGMAGFANICETCLDDGVAQVAKMRRDKIEQDALIKEALHCAFCQPPPWRCEAIHA